MDIRHRTDARGAVLDPNAKLIFPILVRARRHLCETVKLPALIFQLHGAPFAFPHEGGKFRDGGDLFPVHRRDHVAFF